MTVTGDRLMPRPAVASAGDSEAAERRRHDILSAALEVFVERGYAGASIKAIAAEAGLRSPALLYWYFPNKAEIFRGVLRRYLPVLDEDDVQERGFDLPPEAFLGALLRQVLARFADPATRKAYWLLLQEHRMLLDAGFSMQAARPANVVTLVVDYLQHQIDRGVLRPHDPAAVARLLVAQLSLELQARTAPLGLVEPAGDDEALVAATLDIVLRGITP
jgi:TetR/AcrR family transcriptional regulator